MSAYEGHMVNCMYNMLVLYNMLVKDQQYIWSLGKASVKHGMLML